MLSDKALLWLFSYVLWVVLIGQAPSISMAMWFVEWGEVEYSTRSHIA